MQRQIKFRGKVLAENSGMNNTTTDIWVYGSLIVEPDRCIIQWVEKNRVHAEVVDPETVGQYTGLMDKDGVEIYEGDMITDHSFKNDTDLTSLEVKYVAGCFVVECDCEQEHVFDKYHLLTEVIGLGDAISTSVEVIGNLTDTPDLLEGGRAV